MRGCFASLIALIFLVTPWEAKAEEGKWFTTIYYGIYSGVPLDKTFEFKGERNSNRYAGLGLGRELVKWKYASLEAEGMFAEHYGSMGNYEEYIVALGLRYHYFPWDEYVKTTVALVDGPSYTTKQIAGENRYLLNFVRFELTLAYPKYDRLSFALGIHHRSGAKSTLHIGNGDTNFYVLGLRYKF
jgi:hypothetical protein